MDFLRVRCRAGTKKNAPPEIYPSFSTMTREDLMTRGGKFHALWDSERSIWTTKQKDVIRLIDAELRKYRKDHPELEGAKLMLMDDSDSGSIDKWKKYCEKQIDDYYRPLDEKLIFANMKPEREDYSTKSLPYALAKGSHDAWDELVGTLYSPEERHKIEWAIGAVVSGDSKWIQKFLVFYGSGGTGKSTILKIIRDKLFPGYSCSFSAQMLCSGSDRFALEAFKDNPLVAVDSDGELSKIDNNTRLNAVVSHDEMIVDQKYSSLYSTAFNAMLFVGTNKPVKITDAKSGVIRRLIDVKPTGEKIPSDRYYQLLDQIEFELGAIAWHCLGVYREAPQYYEEYIPQDMIGATNDFYNFVEEHAIEFKKKDQTTLNYAWTQYKAYCNEAQVPFPYVKRIFKEELKSYFREFQPRGGGRDQRLWNVYSGFRWEKFRFLFDEEDIQEEEKKNTEVGSWIVLKEQESVFDKIFADRPAQYAVLDKKSNQERPEVSWDNCRTVLLNLDTRKLHYIRVPGNLIVVDFDIRDPETGEKSLALNLEAASKFPKTYVETSKSGGGLHLYYFYDGDVNRLSSVYGDNIEIKTYPDHKRSSVRRKLTLCTDNPIATINSGLPLKEESGVIDFERLKDQKHLVNKLKIFLLSPDSPKKKVKDTKSNVDLIYKTLEEAWESGITYDIRNMRPDILSFAARSSHQAAYCIKLVGQMKFCSKDIEEEEMANKKALESIYDEYVFFDCEVFPNRFGVAYMIDGGSVVKLMSPTPEDIKELCKYKLIGFNNRRYDNHILYAIMMGYSPEEVYNVNLGLINSDGTRNNAYFSEAYSISESDIFDFASKKQSLKKWEIEMNALHKENNIPWDKPVNDEEWVQIMDYCANDVMATAALFHYLEADWKARLMLAEVSGLTPNDTTNQHTTKIIFGDDRNPQAQFVYTDLSKLFPGYEFNEHGIYMERYAPGTKIVSGKSVYMEEDPGEGGYVYAEPGIYENVALLDIASMHPSSIVALNLFGDIYTKRFEDLMKIRLLIKHEKFDEAAKLFDGKLAGYLKDKAQAKQLSKALKIAINSVYGLTSAKFDNKFRDPRNVDNIVAKRGALFMITLKHKLQDMGYSVAHIKTDSIKIPNATPEVIQFVMDFGKQYGYTFEHEATYEKMCLVNEAVYIAKYADGEHEFELPSGEKIMTPWTATGAQFQIPYVFKTLFADAAITFRDVCETKSVSTALYLDFNEGLGDDEHNYVFVGKVGQFCPMSDGSGGGLLLREKDGKYSAATGTKGYRWMESSVVQATGKEDQIDRRYYAVMVDDAIAAISEFGDFESFVS